jgi:exodeoxyribonuclease V
MEVFMLTEQQEIVKKNVINDFFTSTFRKPLIIVGGYAGTGKTFLITKIREEAMKVMPWACVAFCTFTGKASSVLKTKLQENKAYYPDQDFVGTLHSFLYEPETQYNKDLKAFVIVRWRRKPNPAEGFKYLCIDEGSMVSKELWADIISNDIPILVVGDHGQLPPIGAQIDLMEKPNYILTEIQRQVADSPIIKLSAHVRKYGLIPKNTIFGKDVMKISWNRNETKTIWDTLNFDENIIILCGFNTTRAYLNDQVRMRLGFGNKNIPYPGERIVCLQNNRDYGIMNGQIFTVQWVYPIDSQVYRITLKNDETNKFFECFMSPVCFGQVTYTTETETGLEANKKYLSKHYGAPSLAFFDYGYALSVHKSQGSEWQKVIVFEQRSQYWDDDYYKRWLYTAITRAKEKLLVISDFY